MNNNSDMQNTSLGLYHKQEIVNSLIHGFGILFGISCLPILIMLAIKNNNVPGIVGAGIYSFCFLMLFTFSTLFHGFREQTVKQKMKIFDHISIYFLIAGTYTPFLLIYMNNHFGIALLSVLWIFTFFGTLFKIYYTGRFEILSTAVYLMMGCMMLVGGTTFFTYLPGPILILVSVGCLLYVIGVVFYLWEKYVYNHAVWHSLVLSAAICHYVAVLLAM